MADQPGPAFQRALAFAIEVHGGDGDALWERFSTGSGADQLWYYRALADLFTARRPGSPLARELVATVDALAARLAPA